MSIQATHNNSVATQESLRFTLHDLGTPILRRKRTLSVTFLFVVPITLLPPNSSAVTVLIQIVLGLLISLPMAYIVDYRDQCFHSPVHVIRTLRVPPS